MKCRNTFYQHHNFHKTGVNALKSKLAQVETHTDMTLLLSSLMAHFKSGNKIIPRTSQPHYVY